MALERVSFPQGSPPHPPLQENTKPQYLLLSTWDTSQVVSAVGLAPEQWLPWHCLAVKRLGPTKYTGLAAMARKAKHPQSLFAWLLKQELGKCRDARS